MSDSVQPHRRQPTRLPRPWDSPGKNTGVGCHFLLQRYYFSRCIVLLPVFKNFPWFLKDLSSVQFSPVQSLSRVWLFATHEMTAARQASLSITNSQSLPKLVFIESVMPSNHLILCRPLLLLPSIFPSIRDLVYFKKSETLRLSMVYDFLPPHGL